MSIVLFEHNQKAYESALSLMDETGKAAVIHPTGTGKSFIGFKLAEQHPDLKICWLSPSEYIFKTQIENLKAVADGYEPENIIFMTYAKLMVTDIDEIEDIQPDYIVLDEFHRCGAVEWGKGVERLLDAYPDVLILGLSATNIRYLDNQRNMADELFDGNIASEMTLGEAIVRNILLPPIYVTSIYSYQKDLEKYQAKVKRAKNKIVRDTAHKYLDELRRTLTKAEGLDVIFDKYINDRTGKIIIFCSNVEHMNEMIERVPEWFAKIDSAPHIYRVYAEDSSSANAFAEFKADDSNHIKLMFTIDMLNEGIHLDGISSVILFRPTVSPIIYKQQIGRALSASKGQTPVIFDIVRNFENLYSIDSLRDEISESVAFYESFGEKEKIINANFEVIDEVRDVKHLFNELEDSLSASWDMMFEFAAEYFNEHKNLWIPKRYKTPEGYSLGSWIETQRRVKKGVVPGIMIEERIKKLDSIGMVWDSFSDFTFEQSYKYAQAYYKENGNLDVPASYITFDGFALGQWIQNLRSANKGTFRCSLSPDRRNLLDNIEMIWDKNAYLFEKNLAAAREYFITNGNLDVSHKYKTDNGVLLGTWINNVRRKFKHGKLSPSQIERLNELNISWDSHFDIEWENSYRKAVEYYKKFGHLNIPGNYKIDGFALGRWIQRHRLDKGKGKTALKITAERREKLNKIGMIWSIDDSWDTRYELLLKYYKEYGNIDISQNYVAENNIWLGKWLYMQRQIYNGKVKDEYLTEEQILKLESIGMTWITSAERLYDEYLTVAEVFYKANGNLNVPNKYIGNNGKPLDRWLRKQRKLRKENKLNNEQIRKLDALGFDWDKPSQIKEKPEKKYNEQANIPVVAGDVRTRDRIYTTGI